MNKSTKSIAEADEGCFILWLWRLRPGERMARPVRNLDAIDLGLKTCVTMSRKSNVKSLEKEVKARKAKVARLKAELNAAKKALKKAA